MDCLIEVRGLKMYFPVTKGILRRKVADVKAVDDVSFKIKRGETLGLVGETGCGKTTIGRCILRIYNPTAGQIFFEGQDIASSSLRRLRPLRRKMGLVFQDPYGSLDPRQSAGGIVGEPLTVHHFCDTANDYRKRAEELVAEVGPDPEMTNRYPHEFSGGQRQRLGVARALACDPSLMVLDEPISAMDVSIQAQIINMLQELQEKLNLTYLFIAHDLSVVRHLSNRIAVMYLGHIMEFTDWKELYENPLHPYSEALLSAAPIPDPVVEEQRERIILKGDVPSALNPPAGCVFHPRCALAKEECRLGVPPLRQVTANHEVACVRV